MKKWDTKFAIMQDLAELTQGYVPIDIDSCITADRPPAYVLNEDIEDEFFHGYSGDANFSDGPDLASIQNMLDIVNLRDGSGDHDNNILSEFSELDISKPSSESVSTELSKTEEDLHSRTLEDNSRINKNNVALQSILKNNCQANAASNIPLLKPNDFLTPKSPNEPNIGPVSFRRKSPKTSPIDKKTIDKAEIKEAHKINSYVPSSNAAELYKEFTEKVRIRDALKEDIWEKTQKEMQDLDEQYRIEANSFTQIVMENGQERWYPTRLCLPQNRHQLTGDCIVCKVLCAKKTENSIEENSLLPK